MSSILLQGGKNLPTLSTHETSITEVMPVNAKIKHNCVDRKTGFYVPGDDGPGLLLKESVEGNLGKICSKRDFFSSVLPCLPLGVFPAWSVPDAAWELGMVTTTN